MGGPTDAEEAGAEASEQALLNQREGIDTFKDIASQFQQSPFLAKATQYFQQYQDDPFTMPQELQDQMQNTAYSQAAKSADQSFGSYGAFGERAGLSRSGDGAGGLNNLTK